MSGWLTSGRRTMASRDLQVPSVVCRPKPLLAERLRRCIARLLPWRVGRQVDHLTYRTPSIQETQGSWGRKQKPSSMCRRVPRGCLEEGQTINTGDAGCAACVMLFYSRGLVIEEDHSRCGMPELAVSARAAASIDSHGAPLHPPVVNAATTA